MTKISLWVLSAGFLVYGAAEFFFTSPFGRTASPNLRAVFTSSYKRKSSCFEKIRLFGGLARHLIDRHTFSCNLFLNDGFEISE